MIPVLGIDPPDRAALPAEADALAGKPALPGQGGE